MNTELETLSGSPSDEEVVPLINALSEDLGNRFESDGRHSFQDWEDGNPKFIFIKVTSGYEVVGCGAVRPITANTGEVKRMFAKYKRMGIGSAVLSALEEKAKQAGYTTLWLETRVRNAEACNFYLKQGYTRIENYGRYINKPEAACFGKQLVTG